MAETAAVRPYGPFTRLLRDVLPAYADWPLRVAFAAVFLFHGIDKLTDVAGFAAMMGLSEGLAWLVAAAEVSAGALVLAGGFNWPGCNVATRLAGLAVVPVMVGAIAREHWPRWRFTPTEEFPLGGMMFQATLLGLALFFIITAGRISVEDAAEEVGT